MDYKKFSLGIFIDLSEAFDTIDHKILLDILRLYGFRRIVLEWLRSYLGNRLQYVQLSNTNSNTLSLNCCVPQGSVFGPLVFIIIIINITNVSNLAIPNMFTVDTNLSLSDQSLTNLVETANNELAKISFSFKLNKLSLNKKKIVYSSVPQTTLNKLNWIL